MVLTLIWLLLTFFSLEKTKIKWKTQNEQSVHINAVDSRDGSWGNSSAVWRCRDDGVSASRVGWIEQLANRSWVNHFFRPGDLSRHATRSNNLHPHHHRPPPNFPEAMPVKVLMFLQSQSPTPKDNNVFATEWDASGVTLVFVRMLSVLSLSLYLFCCVCVSVG